MSLKQVRQRLGLQHGDIAAAAEVDVDTVNRWEQGLEPMPLKKARLLQAKFELPLAFFRKNVGNTAVDERVLAAYFAARQPQPPEDVPRGTIRVRLLDHKGKSSFRSRNKRHAYVWPITQVEWASITHHLEAGTIHSDAPLVKDWLAIESLDDRLVFINKAAIECIELIDDNTAQMPVHHTDAFYESLHQMLYEIDRVDPDCSGYSQQQINTFNLAISELGGPVRARKVLKDITIERLDGRRLNLPFEQEHAEDLLSSLMDNDQPAVNRFGLVSRGRRSDELHYRFGALRLIEVSKQRWLSLRAAARGG